MTLLSSDGRAVLARGAWTNSGAKAAEYRVCGSRSMKLRVKRGGPAGRFTLPCDGSLDGVGGRAPRRAPAHFRAPRTD